MKKVLFLGYAPTQIPPIQYVLDQGHYVITFDYLPENPVNPYGTHSIKLPL